MTIDTVANPQRGCGTKTAGGFYIEGEGSPNGKYQQAWCLGSHLKNDQGGMWAAHGLPTRGVHIWNPAASLANGYFEHEPFVTPDPRPFGPEWESLVRRVGFGPALIDYVGTAFYSPKRFVQELWRHGPSRKINKATAIKLASLMQDTSILPIFFVTPLPVWTTKERERVVAFARLAAEAWGGQDDVSVDATWRTEGWGLMANDDDGSNHFMALAVGYDHEETVKVAATNSVPALFCVSWITRPPVYIAPTMDDALNPPTDIVRAGIRVGVLEDGVDAQLTEEES